MNFRLQRSHLIIAVAILAAAAFITYFFPKQDFSVYYSAGRSLLAGRADLYAPDFANAGVMDYRYLPAFILLFLPFALLPFAISAFLWSAFGLAAVVAAFKQIATVATEGLGTSARGIVLLCAVLLSAKYLLIALKYQNAHLIAVALVFTSFCLLLRGNLLPAALLFALSVAIKVFPLLLLPYFAIKRQWRFLGMSFGFILMFLLLPAYYFGINSNIDLHQEWLSKVVNESEFYELNGPPNLSIPGQTMRYLTTVRYDERVLDRSYANVNFAETPEETAKLVGRVLAGLIALITVSVLFFANRLGQKDEENKSLALHEFGFAICMMLLVGPRTNIIYFTAMFVSYVALLTSFFHRRSLTLWIAVITVSLATIVLPLVPGARAQRLFIVLGVDTIAALAVWGALGWLLVERLRSKPTPSAAAQSQ